MFKETPEKFQQYVGQSLAHFEKRRKIFIRRLITRLLLSIAVIGVLGFYQWHETLAYGYLFYASIIFILFIFTVHPILDYKNNVVQLGNILPGATGITQIKFSIKEEIYKKLLAFFGNFALSDNRQITLDLSHSNIVPEFDDYVAEERISGIYNATHIDIFECKLFKKGEVKKNIFKGMLVVIDISDSDTRLRGQFTGKTVVIEDKRKNLEWTKQKYASFERIDLPTSEYEKRFEAYTTDKNEAKYLVTKELLDAVEKLGNVVNNTTMQYEHADNKYLLWLGRVTSLMGSLILDSIGFITTFGDYKGSFREELKAFQKDGGETVDTINRCIQCSFYEDKVLLTVPYKHDLFEPDPMWKPPLNNEDISLLYNIMSTVMAISEKVTAAKSKSTIPVE